MLKFCIYFLPFLLLVAAPLTGCKTQEKMVYFQGSEKDSVVVSAASFTPEFRVDDFLSIVITAEDPEAAKVYNLPTQQSKW